MIPPIVSKLKILSRHMKAIATELKPIHPDHAKELLGASKIAAGWAEGLQEDMENESR